MTFVARLSFKASHAVSPNIWVHPEGKHCRITSARTTMNHHIRLSTYSKEQRGTRALVWLRKVCKFCYFTWTALSRLSTLELLRRRKKFSTHQDGRIFFVMGKTRKENILFVNISRLLEHKTSFCSFTPLSVVMGRFDYAPRRRHPALEPWRSFPCSE